MAPMSKKTNCKACLVRKEIEDRRRDVNFVFAVRAGNAWSDLEKEALLTLQAAQTFLESRGFETTIAPSAFPDAEFYPILTTYNAMTDMKGERLEGRGKDPDPIGAKQRALERLANMVPVADCRRWKRAETRSFLVRVESSSPEAISVTGGWMSSEPTPHVDSPSTLD